MSVLCWARAADASAQPAGQTCSQREWLLNRPCPSSGRHEQATCDYARQPACLNSFSISNLSPCSKQAGRNVKEMAADDPGRDGRTISVSWSTDALPAAPGQRRLRRPRLGWRRTAAPWGRISSVGEFAVSGDTAPCLGSHSCSPTPGAPCSLQVVN